MARQPIFDRAKNVVAYELLYRRDDSNSASIADPDRATTEVFLNTFMEIGLDRVTGEHRAFINLTRPFLLGEYPLPFDGAAVTLEILEDIEPDAEVIEAVTRLSRQGYEIALDDFVFDEKWLPLIPLVDIIKIDIRQVGILGLEDQLSRLSGHKARLLAEKVETPAEFTACLELGFDLFQGYFFCQPSVLRGKRTSPSRLATLQLLQKLNTRDFKFDELAEVISTDVTLAYKLLRYINSAYFGLARKVESIQHALVMLGEKNIRLWMNLIALSQVQDKTRELLVLTLARAKMCERIAEYTGRESDKDKYFLAGLFSTVDAFIDMPMEEIVSSVALADEVRDAITGFKGPIGKTLKLVCQSERGVWDAVDSLGLGGERLTVAYLDAINWAGSATSFIEG